MARLMITAAVVFICFAVFVSAQHWKDGDDDGCIEENGRRGFCVKGNRNGWKGRKETCNGVCVNTGDRNRDRCQCQEARFGNRRPANGWNPATGWGK